MQPRRILVLGATGSGKSTLAAAVAEYLSLPYQPTDPLFWTADWGRLREADVRPWVIDAAAQDRWVLDGNFHSLRSILWPRAELIVWLDLPWPLTIARVLKRNLLWWASGKPVWVGRRMPLGRALSGVGFALRTRGFQRQRFPGDLAAMPSVTVLRFTSNREADAWLASL